MATIPEVKVKITGDARGLQAASNTAQGALARLGSDLRKLQGLAAGALAFTGIGGAASFGGILTLARNAADAAVEMGGLARRTGVSVEELTRLEYAASKNEVTLDALAAGLRRVAEDAGKTGKNLALAGVALVDSSGRVKTADELFREVADRFASLPDGIQKTSLAATIFGTDLGAKLIPVLSLGSKGLKSLSDESDRFGKTITAAQVAHAESFNDAIARLGPVARVSGYALGTALIPALNDLALAFLQIFEEDKKVADLNGVREWGDKAARAVALVVDAVDGATRVFQGLGLAIGALAAATAAVITGDVASAKRVLRELGSDLENLAMRRLFSSRLAELQSQEVRAAQGNVDVQKKLTEAVLRLQSLRSKAAAEANAEELKGVERLRDALRNAWQASIDGARKARDEASALLVQAADARTAGTDAADARRARGNTPAQNDRDARLKAEQARSAANFAASSAVIAAFQGRLAESKKLSDEAVKQAARAEKLAENIINDVDAARLLEQIGVIREDALKAQAKVKEKEAAELEVIAKQQNDQILKAEERIKALKAELEKPVVLKTDIANAESEVKRLKAELDKITDKTVTVTVNTVNAGATPPVQGATPAPGFWAGGYTGPGGKFQPAGIVHAGEYVLRQEVVRQRGMRSLLDRLNMQGINALAERGYANGGHVSESPTSLNLHWPDGTVSKVSADRSTADEIKRVFRHASLARGRRK